MSVQRLLQRKSILSSTKQELMTNDPSLAKCVMSSMLVTQTTTITWECINQRKKTRLLKCEKCYYETTHKQHLNRHILTVHNEKKDSNKSKNRSFPYCGKSFLQQRYLTRHKKIHRKGDENDIAVSSGFCFVWSFPLFSFSPTGEVQQPVKSVKWGVNFGTYAANALRFLRIPGIWRNTPKEGTPRK